MRVVVLSLTILIPAAVCAQDALGTVTYQDWTGASAPEQNIRFSKLDSGTPIPTALTYQSNRVLNAAGTEVPWQAMSNGDLMVRAAVPASILPASIFADYAQTSGAGYTVSYGTLEDVLRASTNLPCSSVPKNTALTFVTYTGGTLPAGLSVNTPYFVVGCGQNGGYTAFSFAASYNGPPVSFSGGTAGGFFEETLAAVAAGSTITSASHGYVNGNSIEFGTTDGSSLPNGLSANTIYFVCNARADTFQVSASGDCSRIVTVTSLAAAIPQVISTLSWTLQSGLATSALAVHPPSAVSNGNTWTLSNGLTGVRLPTPAYEAANNWSLAPLQSLQLADGSWTPNAGSILLDVNKNHNSSSAGSGYSVAFAENGLLEIALAARLSVNRAMNYYGGNTAAAANPATNTLAGSAFHTYMPYSLYVAVSGAGLTAGQVVYVVNQNKSAGSFQVSAVPAGPPIVLSSGTPQFLLLTQEPGPGYYNVTATLDANTKAVMVLEDHNIHDFSYNLDTRPNLVANTARFRSNSYADQSVTLLTSDRTSSYYSSSSTIRPIGSQYEPNNQGQTGHYWMLYNSAGAAAGNAVGIFLGKGSLQYYGEFPHGPGVFDTPSMGTQGFTIWDQQPAPTQTYYTGETRKSWGFWAGAMADVLAPTVIQPIDVVRDTLAGINLTRINSYDLNFPDPRGGWSDLYESTSAVATLTSLLGDGTSVCGSANCLYDAIQTDSVQQPLAELLMDDTAPRIDTSLSPLTTQLQSFATIFYNQMGNLDPTIAYYQGAYPCVRYSSMANLIMMSPAATAWQKQQAKHFLGFCAGFLWDPDFYSTDPSVGGGLGDQETQFLQQKAQFATELSSNPDMQPLVQQSVANIEANLLGNINAYGSGYASWHYQGATTDQALFGWLNLAAAGQLNIADFPQVALFGQWYMSGITPPEVRFGTTRMYISNGDGNTESESSPGLLATLLRPAYPALASNLAYVWASQGYSDQDIGSFAAPSLLAIDFTIPKVDPKLTSQHFPGSHSMLRSGWGTAFENAADFLYGGYYSAQGHAHTDTGRVAAYLLGAPISIDWNPNLYNPEVAGRFQHSTVCLDSELAPDIWSEDNSPLSACGTQFTGASPDNTNLIETSTFTGSSGATAAWTKPADGTTFQRSVQLLNYDPNFAILHVVDTFSGAQAADPKTLTWNLMAENGAVATSAGTVVPAVRQNLGNNGVLPSSSPVYTLTGNGLQKFAFEGAVWSTHATGGVDFDLYTRNADQQQFVLGNWCHNQYQNNCALESQDILRLHGTGDFDSWIVARKKGSADPAVSLQACGIQVALSGTLCFDAAHSQYDNGAGTQTLATYDGSSHSAFGMTISGGPAECVLAGSNLTCTIQGWQPGTPTISLPAGFYPSQPTVFNLAGQVLAYSENGQALELAFTNQSQNQGEAALTAPAVGTQSVLSVVNSSTGARTALAGVAGGTTISFHAAPDTYSIQWTSDSGQSESMTIDVPAIPTRCVVGSASELCNPRLR